MEAPIGMDRRVLLLVGTLAMVVLAGCTGLPGAGDGGEADDGTVETPQPDVDATEPAEVPANMPNREVIDGDLREGEAKDELRYRNATAGDEINFVPKEMNESTLPDNENERELIMYGRTLMANTSEEMPEHVGNDLSCASCHGGGQSVAAVGMVGQDINLIPLVGTSADLPEWTGRRNRMRDTRQRLIGCFQRSMNSPGSEEGAPDYDSREIQAMEAYMMWLSEGVPTKGQPYWSHLNKPTGDEKVPVEEVNPVRGAELYLENCASCHGADGQGEVDDDGSVVYPPLWGPRSFNDGAGMGRMYTSASYIREAMPYGYAHDVTDWEDVHDIAGFMNAHDRPEFPEKSKDFPDGTPDEGIYYNRTQERLGYEMNPMKKKLMLADMPTGTQPLNESDIPDDVGRYDQPLRNETVDPAEE